MGNKFRRMMTNVASLVLCWCCCAAVDIKEPSESFYVADYANVISEETSREIIDRSARLYETTGAQIVVETVEFTNGVDMETYAYETFNSWGIGTKGKENGVLLVLSIGDDDYWAVTGAGLEGILSAGALDDILYEFLEPDFGAGNYDAGIEKTYSRIYSTLEKYYGTYYDDDDSNDYYDQNYSEADDYYGYGDSGERTARFNLLFLIPGFLGLTALVFSLNSMANVQSGEFSGGLRYYWNLTHNRRPRYPTSPPPPPNHSRSRPNSNMNIFRGNPFSGHYGGSGRSSGSRDWGGGMHHGGHFGGGGSTRGGGAGRRRG